VTLTVLRPSASGAATLSWAYAYDGNGNLVAVTDTLTGSSVAGYGYDELDLMALAGSPRRCSPKLPGREASGARQVSYAA
jgi:hypothetical protein